MKIHQFFTENELRNFTYILEFDTCLWVLDPWDAEQVITWAKPLNKNITTILNTHEHWDHIRGNRQLAQKFGAEVWAHEKAKGKIDPLHRTLKDGEVIKLEGNYQLRVLDTPGHTMAHLCFVISNQTKDLYLFSGDTLFNAGVGHCRMGGDPETLYETIYNQILNLDDEVILYPGHDYIVNNLGFTLSVEPQNSRAKELLDKFEKKSWKERLWNSKLKDEREINTFLRLESDFQFSEKPKTPKQVFLKLRELRNHW